MPLKMLILRGDDLQASQPGDVINMRSGSTVYV